MRAAARTRDMLLELAPRPDVAATELHLRA